MQDRLFVFRPGFRDEGRVSFCPFSAQVMGFLTYYPQVKATLEVIELDWPKPRQPLVDLLGEEHQSAPMLVLGGEPVQVPDVKLATANGHTYIEKTIQILHYLAATRSVPGPH